MDIKVKDTIRDKILDFEEEMSKLPDVKFGDDAYPLKHSFADGIYVREINVPKGELIVTKIFKQSHAMFLLKGKCSILTVEGVKKIEAPFHMITAVGTKRIIYTHEDVVWVTVHNNSDNSKDLNLIENKVIAKTFDQLPTQEEIKQLKEA